MTNILIAALILFALYTFVSASVCMLRDKGWNKWCPFCWWFGRKL